MARYPKMNDPGGKNVIPSVTEIIGDCTDKSGALTQWAANQVVEWIRENCECADDPCDYYMVDNDELNEARFNFKTVSQKALNIGSEVHAIIENYLKWIMYQKGGIFKLPIHITPEARNSINAFYEWADEHNLEPISLEQTIYGNGWAGTLDFRGFMRHKDWDRKKAYIIDWKSSKAHYPEMRYQSAAYRSESDPIIQEYNGIKLTYPIEGCGVLRLDKETGLFDWKDTSKSYEQDLRIFHRMVDLYFERHPIIRKRARGELWHMYQIAK